MKNTTPRNALVHAAIMAMLAVWVAVPTHAQANEPEEAVVALLLDAGSTLDILEDGKVIVFGAGPAPSNSSQKSLDSYFPFFAYENLNQVHAMTVTKGNIYNNITWAIGSLGAPSNGSMVLNDEVTILYMGLVSESSNTFSEDAYGDKLLIILSGPVR